MSGLVRRPSIPIGYFNASAIDQSGLLIKQKLPETDEEKSTPFFSVYVFDGYQNKRAILSKISLAEFQESSTESCCWNRNVAIVSAPFGSVVSAHS